MAAHDTGDTSGLVRWSAVGGSVGTVSFFFLILVIGTTHGGYSALSDEISQLGAAGVSGAWAQSANFIVFGLIVIALAWGLHRGIHRWPWDKRRSPMRPFTRGFSFGSSAAWWCEALLKANSVR